MASVICTAVFNYEEDIGAYTIKAVDDPRTLNKILYMRPPKNTYSSNELVALWIEPSFVKGDHTNFEIEPSFGFEASQLYPGVKYTTVQEYLSRLVFVKKD
ncbi:NmrA-like protein [Corchorus olitorius]|uniref:NmrA-like protein n=1 Tax=Corchorus olitorius TaxID=93759 RepID=A0A1R3HXW8_9ROSI|nr:NmrA-like protein [Corchorus olitorius]